MSDSKSKFWANVTEGQKLSIIEFIASLERDDVENSKRNAERCLDGEGYLELQNMVADYYYRAGINHAKNEIREILGLPRLMTDREKKQLDYDLKHPMGSLIDWDCPELQAHEYEVVEGSAKLIPLGDDQLTMVVIGTKDRKKAARMMRRYSMDWWDREDAVQDSELEFKKMVWRDAKYEGEDDHTHMFSWSARDTKNNPKAVDAFILEG